MPKLTAKQIQFIDKYLENSDVEYVDIRFEMVDHVASALEQKEGDFIENFRQYMLEHKQVLLSQLKDFKRTANRKAFRLIGIALLRPICLIAVAIIFGLQFIFTAFTSALITEVYQISYITVEMIAFGVMAYYRLISKRSFSTTEQLFWLWFFSGIVIHSTLFSANDYLLRGYYSVNIIVLLVTIITFLRLYKQYDLKYRVEI